MTRNNDDKSSRRTFLKATAATGTVAGVGGVAINNVTGQERQEYRFGGEVAGWMGRAPSQIEGQTNPTIQLQAGQEYAITWENTDGRPHNVAILDNEGNAVESTEIISEQGATQTLEFTAREGMAEYVCEVHPASMRGDIRFEGQTTTAGEEEAERFMPRGAGIGVQQVASGLTSPVALRAPPNDDRQFILDQVGQIYVHGPDGLQDEPFLDIRDRLVDVGGREGSNFDERGLLGIAFHPDFQNNGRFFLRYSVPLTEPPFVSSVDWSGVEDLQEYDHVEVLGEFQASDDLSTGDPESETRLLEMPSPQFNHNAGDVAFGPDGYLYVPTGDGGDADDTGLGHVEDWYDANEGGNGQDVTQNLMGGVLRIDVNSEQENLPYGIPDDNPFAEGGAFSDYEGLPEYFAWGFRNPWKASFNDGELYAASNGQNLFEQVDIVQQGGNHAWNVKEATHCFSTENPNEPPEECPSGTPDSVRGGEPFIDPIIEYPHTYQGRGVGVSVIGGHIYSNDAISGVTGKYVFGDYSRTGADPAGRIFAATRPGEADGTTTEGGETTTGDGGGDSDELWSLEELQIAGAPNGQINMFILAFGQDSQGRIYVLGNDMGVPVGDTGKVYRIVPAGEGEEVERPRMETTTTTTMAKGETTTEGGGMTTTEDGGETTTTSN
ncbi:PQQ-dependent sugar dehydrogenase [Halorussus lipolyticus]|uniref:PQQ-dependent sugar dehydrogenase n=1 Tax=Halorussus lipolyticus TaxID=3034024 RepID=UPI0023E80974|nr:PQQ-dependent sugar dehydrogenase [Halorussus sp. DT80]